MAHVFGLDANTKPLALGHPGRARRLLTQQKAAVFRRYPFTIILQQAKPHARPAPLRVKMDPGSKTTGRAVLNDATGAVVLAAELPQRGQHVKEALDTRRAQRRGRRKRQTRYRQPRFAHRARPQGWLPPSRRSRIQNVVTWVERRRRSAPVGAISFELVRVAPQRMDHPTLSGIAYQHGTLAGWEVREYLRLKWGDRWGDRCASCHQEAPRWEVDHITARSRGGSHRVTNLALSCQACNQEQGDRTAAESGHPDVQAEARRPLKDAAAALNSTRWALDDRLKQTALPIETGTGGRTKGNRTQRELPKTHWIAAACVGASTP